MSAPETADVDPLDAVQGLAPPDPSDEEIVRLVLAGRADFYEQIMRRHNRLLYRVVRSVFRDEIEVEDVIQDAYVAAFRRLDQFEGRARFSTWLARIAFHKAVDRKRQLARRSVGETDGIGAGVFGRDADDPERATARRQVGRAVAAAVDDLPDTYRSVFVLREVEGLDTKDTARCLGLRPGAVKVRLFRARRLLRSRLEGFGGSVEQIYPFGGERCDRTVRRVRARLGGRPTISS